MTTTATKQDSDTATGTSDSSGSTPPDGTFAVSAVDGQTWLIGAGRRLLVTGPSALFATGVTDPKAIRSELLDKDRLDRIPIAGGIATLVGTKQVDTGDMFLGGGHYMRTWGSVSSSGQIAMQTRTRAINWFNGYHGAASLIAADSDDAPTFSSGQHRYGVDGTMVGQSDRTDAWWENMTADQVARTVSISIFQTWAPDDFQKVLDEWVLSGKKIAELATSVGTVAKVVTSIIGTGGSGNRD